MTPGARIQAAIDLVSDAFLAPGGQPPSLDRAIKSYFRSRRYAGSKDRRFVRDLVWQLCRQRGELMALTGQDWQDTPNARLLVLAYVWQTDGEEAVRGLCIGDGHAPATLSDEEITVLQSMADVEPPNWAWVNMPAWLDDNLSQALGQDYDAFNTAMGQRAKTGIRCNPAKADLNMLQTRLEEETDAEFAVMALSPMGLVTESGVDLATSQSFKDGLFDIQDEAAQLACLYAGLQPGMQVLDYCAGGGGKALALASATPDHGGIDCHDSDPARMKDIPVRAKRSGLSRIKVLAKEPPASAPLYDIVLVDVPCSGSGVWRRHPDDRWRWSRDELSGLVDLQQEILENAAAWVKPGGNLVYMTCSVLQEENQLQKTAFLNKHKNYAGKPVNAPNALVQNGDLVLRPDLHDCDGFYMAQFTRTG